MHSLRQAVATHQSTHSASDLDLSHQGSPRLAGHSIQAPPIQRAGLGERNTGGSRKARNGGGPQLSLV